MAIARIVPFVIAALLALPAAAQAPNRPVDGWQFALTPYLWLPNINGTLKFNVPPGSSGSPDVETGPNDYLSNLDFVLMLAGEARRGNWAVISDLIYLDFSGEKGAVRSVAGPGGTVQVPLNANTQTGFRGLVLEVAASFTAARSDMATFEVLGGARYVHVEASLDWQFAGPIGLMPQAGSFSQKEELLDAIGGVRGKARLGGGDWFVSYYLDAGTGSSRLTWQGIAGLGYAYKWGDLLFAYRHLYYDQKGDKLLQDVRFSGPALGAAFRF